MTPKISVVIPAFNAENSITETVRAVMGQPLVSGMFECIVVDDGSVDRTGQIARAAGARIVRLEENRGAGGARNAGIACASGEWVVFTDADMVPSRRWLREILAAIENADASILVIAGKTLGLDSVTSAARFMDLIGALDAEVYLKNDTMPWAPSGNVAYRREHLVAIGGFDASFKTYEGADLHLRLTDRFGGRTEILPGAIVLHRHRRTWRELWRQQCSYGVGYGQFMQKYSDRWPWSAGREFAAWRQVMGHAICACFMRRDAGLVQRGLFIKRLAQRIGFAKGYYMGREARGVAPIQQGAPCVNRA